MGVNTLTTTLVALVCLAASIASSEEKPAPSAERGKEAVWSVASPLSMSVNSWNTIWKQWELADRPQDFDKLAQDRYGLLPSTRRDDRFPLGINELKTVVGPVLSNNCLLCHAGRIGNGQVVGVDFGESQIQRAIETAKDRGIRNAVFQQADCYSLPFEDASFDRVFSNALMEHLTDPVRAMRELLRMLKSGGVIGVSSPDWAGFVLAPSSDALTAAVAAYTALQTRNGGDVNVGRKLSTHLESAGFLNCQMSARYEVYPSRPLIGEYLAVQLDRAGDSASAATFRSWSRESGGLFAQCWVSCLAQSPTPSLHSPGS